MKSKNSFSNLIRQSNRVEFKINCFFFFCPQSAFQNSRAKDNKAPLPHENGPHLSARASQAWASQTGCREPCRGLVVIRHLQHRGWPRRGARWPPSQEETEQALSRPCKTGESGKFSTLSFHDGLSSSKEASVSEFDTGISGGRGYGCFWAWNGAGRQ